MSENKKETNDLIIKCNELKNLIDNKKSSRKIERKMEEIKDLEIKNMIEYINFISNEFFKENKDIEKIYLHLLSLFEIQDFKKWLNTYLSIINNPGIYPKIDFFKMYLDNKELFIFKKKELSAGWKQFIIYFKQNFPKYSKLIKEKGEQE